MTTYKITDPDSGEELDLELSVTPYEIMSNVYHFLVSVKTPELNFCEEAQEELTKQYNIANMVLGDGKIPDTAREQFLASTFFSMGMKMGKTAAWPIGEQAMEAVNNAKAPQVKGGKVAPWKVHEEVILSVLDLYESDENRLKRSKDSSRLTQKKAIDKIETQTNQILKASTFNSWLNKYRENDGKVFS